MGVEVVIDEVLEGPEPEWNADGRELWQRLGRDSSMLIRRSWRDGQIRRKEEKRVSGSRTKKKS